jgi:chromosomal replication initiator protein
MSQMEGGHITLALAYQALGRGEEASPITIPDIIQAVTSWYGVRAADLQSRKRHKSITRPRQVCMYLARHLTDHSLGEIGGYFGGRDHTTVLHATRLVAERRQEDSKLDEALGEISQTLRRRRAGASHDVHK